MKGIDLKVDSILEIEVNLSPELMNQKIDVTITRCSDSYVWFKHSGFQRIGRNTIDKFPTLFKIKSI